MSEYINEMESVDYECLKHFNSKLNLTELGQTRDKYFCDASGYTSVGDYVSVEIKKRNQQLMWDSDNGFYIIGYSHSGNKYSGTTLYIDEHKMTDLLLDYTVNKHIPLYVNFLDNDFVVVYNLNKLESHPNGIDCVIYSKGLQKYQRKVRMELPLRDAYIYQREGDKYNLIKKGGVECLNPNSN